MSGCGTHGGQLWYKHVPGDFLDGVKALSAEERGCYITVLDLIYQFGGKIADRAQWIAGQCNVSVKRWNKIRLLLVEGGKLLEGDGVLTNPRATAELSKLAHRSEARAEAGRRGGRKSGASRRNSRNKTGIPNEYSDLDEAGLHAEEGKVVTNDLADYPPDNPPEELGGCEGNQPVSGSRDSRSSRVHIYPSTESVSREDDDSFRAQEHSPPLTENVVPMPRPPNPRQHPANAPALQVYDYRVTFNAKGQAEVNGSLLDIVVQRVTEAAWAEDGFYPTANCTHLIDLLCEGYDPDEDICPVITRLAASGHRAKPMKYYATAIRNSTRPSWKPIGTWGVTATPNVVLEATL